VKTVLRMLRQRLKIRSLREGESRRNVRSLADEISLCREISGQTIFILGFARSSTTITTQLLNSAPNVLLLGEANFYLRNTEPRFSDWYNRMHFGFRNQVSKTSYAPDFVPEIEHDWLDWLSQARKYYAYVGDKMAFSAQHFGLAEPSAIQSFFESRFFDARYVFTIREPVQTLLSAARLFGIQDNRALIPEILAWLRFVQLWADWVRTFPSTYTFAAEDLGPETLADLQRFLGIDLSGAESFISPPNRTRHCNMNLFPTLAQIDGEMSEIFGFVKAAIKTRPPQLQLSGELRPDRSRPGNETPSLRTEATLPSKTPIYSAWAACERLIGHLQPQVTISAALAKAPQRRGWRRRAGEFS
jgi:Sulfotransferase family